MCYDVPNMVLIWCNINKASPGNKFDQLNKIILKIKNAC